MEVCLQFENFCQKYENPHLYEDEDLKLGQPLKRTEFPFLLFLPARVSYPLVHGLTVKCAHIVDPEGPQAQPQGNHRAGLSSF